MFFIYYWKEEGQGIRAVLELEGWRYWADRKKWELLGNSRSSIGGQAGCHIESEPGSLASLFPYVLYNSFVWAHLQQESFSLGIPGAQVVEAYPREGSSLPLLVPIDFKPVYTLISLIVISILWKWWEFGPPVYTWHQHGFQSFTNYLFSTQIIVLLLYHHHSPSWWVGTVSPVKPPTVGRVLFVVPAT